MEVGLWCKHFRIIPNYNPLSRETEVLIGDYMDAAEYYRDISIDGHSIYDTEYRIEEKGIHQLEIGYIYFNPIEMKSIVRSETLPIEIR